MTLTSRSRLATAALVVGAALRQHGIEAVLTGGACASLYTAGTYQSRDMDFVLMRDTTQARLDAALSSVGFARAGDRYVHPHVPFYVEFPRGPLAIGGDFQIRPVTHSSRVGRAFTLSATDSCRDRLAAFYHWNDRQSLQVAARIAARQPVDLKLIRQWSEAEGFPQRFEEFRAQVRRARAGRRRTRR